MEENSSDHRNEAICELAKGMLLLNATSKENNGSLVAITKKISDQNADISTKLLDMDTKFDSVSTSITEAVKQTNSEIETNHTLISRNIESSRNEVMRRVEGVVLSTGTNASAILKKVDDLYSYERTTLSTLESHQKALNDKVSQGIKDNKILLTTIVIILAIMNIIELVFLYVIWNRVEIR